MRFSVLREFNDKLCATTGLHEREQILRELFASCSDTAERVIAAQLLVGRLSPSQEGLTTDIKEAFIAKDLGLEGRQSLESIGEVAMQRCDIGRRDPDIGEVWSTLRLYLESPGRKAADKSRIVNAVMFDMAAERRDVPLLLQILCGKVSNGIKDTIVLHALAARAPADPLLGVPLLQSERQDINRAFSFNPDLAQWVAAFDDQQSPVFADLLAGRATPGIALEPQLCDRVDDLDRVLAHHRGATVVQPKLDGQRVHLHTWNPAKGASQVRIFSRSLKNCTEDYPEILHALLPVSAGRKRVILDGELVALGPDGEIAPFSVLQKRLGRKTGRDEVQVGVVLYDVLLWDDEPVQTMRYTQRMDFLQQVVLPALGPRFRVIESEVVDSGVVLRERLLAAYEKGEEGLVCKDPRSVPAPGMRSKDWLKIKPDYIGKGQFADTFDLVVIGYQIGRGKRHGLPGALWVAIRDDRTGNLWPVCKVGTGLKDTDLLWFDYQFSDHDVADQVVSLVRSTPHPSIDGLGKPPEVDVWVEPSIVIEVGATGGMTKIDKWAGFSLRFPYFVRVREDKTVAQATSTGEVDIP